MAKQLFYLMPEVSVEPTWSRGPEDFESESGEF
jgi:hypothetical protein